MSNHANKILLALIVFVFFLFSCKSNKESINEQTNLYKSYSTKQVTQPVYESVFHSINDSMNNWVKNNLSTYLYCKLNRWAFDSLICFNKTGEQCVMALAYQHDSITTAAADFLIFFYGVKIKEQWFFFSGASVVLPRENYQSDTHVPLSFDKLHQIAMKEVFSGYLIKDAKGNWQINDRFFDYFKGNGWAFHRKDGSYVQYPSEEQIDSLIIASTAAMWSKKDTTPYDKTK